jgi:small subunit ribosomal protein S21
LAAVNWRVPRAIERRPYGGGVFQNTIVQNTLHALIDSGGNVVKLTLRDRESVQEAVRRFRKLVERSGVKKEMRRREYYEKPSEIKRRARLRAERRSRRVRTPI